MRREEALKRRQAAAEIALNRDHPVHAANGEERAYREAHSFMSFTKGLPHNRMNGVVRDVVDPLKLRAAIDAGFAQDFDLHVPLGDRDSAGDLQWKFYSTNEAPLNLSERSDGDQHRRWEAPTAGFAFDLEGPDCQAVTMPPAPPLVSAVHEHGTDTSSNHGIEANPELVAEMAEVYWLAALRDTPFAAFDGVSRPETDPGAKQVQRAVDHLAALPFYKDLSADHPRRRLMQQPTGMESLSRQNVMRGHTAGDRKGPYLSQFLLMGSSHLGSPPPHSVEQGFLQYGSIRTDMRVRIATPECDYMTHWDEWLDVQNGANVIDAQKYEEHCKDHDGFRFITRPRDLATYVHFDALYEAYLNACVWLLNEKAPVDPSFQHLLGKTRHTEGFALYGGPHILSLLTEVATRGLKAVRFQKFNNHLRLRPEALAGRLAAYHQGEATGTHTLEGEAKTHTGLLYNTLNQTIGGTNLLNEMGALNASNNARHATYLGSKDGIAAATDLPLLPMAFPEGSPMHPSYGAGHATVAGACVTILKAFFDESACLVRNAEGQVKAVSQSALLEGDYKPVAFVPTNDGKTLDDKGASFQSFLSLGDELNKLAANISIGRDMAGVHYYSDYIDSLRMGEEIAMGILQEQSILYPTDSFHVSLTTFDNQRVVIGDGEIQSIPQAHWKSGHAFKARKLTTHRQSTLQTGDSKSADAKA